MTTRRPGRVQRIAFDATPLNSTQPDVDSRIGWLLAMSRLHHADAAYGDGSRFAAALADVGCTATRSLVSRWESGEIAVSYEGMAAYEAALGLQAGRISSLTGYIRAAIPGVKARVVRPRLDPSTRSFAVRLDELIDLAEAGTASAREWQDLGWHVAATPHVHLQTRTWEVVANRIVTMLPRSVKVAYRQASTAAMNIASLTRAQDFLVDAIAAYVADPDAQVLTNPLGLLDRLPTRDSARLVLRTIEHPQNDSVYRMAVWLATQKVHRGDFSGEERTRLDMAVLRLWRANPAKAGEDLAELIAGLPVGLRSTLTTAADKAGRPKLGYVVEHGEELVAARARSLAQDIADGARARAPQPPSYDEDRMLPRLVREALFHRDSERRHLAALLISASPFGDGVADELLEMLDDAAHPRSVRARAATTVRYLSGEPHRMRLLRLVQDPVDEVAAPLLQALGHLEYDGLTDQVLRSMLGDAWSPRRRATVYALGMTGSPSLAVIRDLKTAPAWQRAAARWWIAQGPAIHA